jgi:type II secretory pathway component PulK
MHRNRESGVALLSAILVLMLMSALLVGFMAIVNSDQSASGINRDQTQAYAAAHAGVEKLTADLGELFQSNFAPNATEIGNLTVPAKQPALPGISYLRPNGLTGYRISYNDVVAPIGEPAPSSRGHTRVWSG